MNDLLEYQIENKIYTLRSVQVMLDRDLAKLYQVETRALKQAVKRNIDRFPDDFMFELTEEEIDFMVSQNVIPFKEPLRSKEVPLFLSALNNKMAVEMLRRLS